MVLLASNAPLKITSNVMIWQFLEFACALYALELKSTVVCAGHHPTSEEKNCEKQS